MEFKSERRNILFVSQIYSLVLCPVMECPHLSDFDKLATSPNLRTILTTTHNGTKTQQQQQQSQQQQSQVKGTRSSRIAQSLHQCQGKKSIQNCCLVPPAQSCWYPLTVFVYKHYSLMRSPCLTIITTLLANKSMQIGSFAVDVRSLWTSTLWKVRFLNLYSVHKLVFQSNTYYLLSPSLDSMHSLDM